MPKLKVLFIDDDETLQLLASAMMNTGVFDIVSARRTAEAEKVLSQQKVDIIVLDVMMPDEDGIQYAKRLRASGRQTPLLMLSAVSDPSVMRQAIAAGATDYLIKPFDIHALQKKILSMMGQAPKPQRPASSSTDASKSSGLFGWLKR